jgi:tRNA-dihydrouridine synthase 4
MVGSSTSSVPADPSSQILAKEFNRSAHARDSGKSAPASGALLILPDLTLSPTPLPTIVQFGAHQSEDFSRASLLAAPFVSGIDLNCGCPQSWACASGVGAALLQRRELVAEMVSSARALLARHGHADRTISVKIRVDTDLRRSVDFVRTVQAAGADFITIHGRTRRTRSSEPVDRDAIRLVAQHCSVPVLANGDVASVAGAAELAADTGAQGVMSSRALLANPALFAGHDSCPWESLERYVQRVVRAPVPFKLALHHVSEMVADASEAKSRTALVSRPDRAEMMKCANMLELIDWLDDYRGLDRG